MCVRQFCAMCVLLIDVVEVYVCGKQTRRCTVRS